jgi:NADPH2:quinone reductase
MRAVAYTKSLPVSDPACFVEVELERPVPGPRDLLVKVEAVSVNPVDFKIRRRDDPGGKPRSSAMMRPERSKRSGPR